MKKKVSVLLIIGTAVVLVVGAVVINAISVAEQLGNNQSTLATDTTAMAMVGKYQITRYDVEKYRINQQFMIEVVKTGYNEEYTDAKLLDEEILAKLIENKVLLLEAEKEGFIVSDEIIHDYINELIKVIDSTDSMDVSVLKDYIRGQDMTIDEYFNSYFDTYKEQMSIGKLRFNALGRIEDMKEATVKWEQYKKELVQNNQSIIKIIEPN